MEVAPVFEVSRAEERGSELSIREHPLGDGLGDGGLPRSGQTIQPVDGGLVEVPCPEFDLVQNNSASPPETTFPAAMPVLGLLGAAKIVEDSCFGCQKIASRAGCRRWGML